MKSWGIWKVIGKTFSEWNEDNASRLSASLAFYTMISIAPLLVIAIFIASHVFSRQAVNHAVADQLQGLMGPMAAQAIETMLVGAGAYTSGGGVAAIIGVAVLAYGATNVFTELQDSMNLIWEVKPNPRLAWWAFLKTRLLSFAMVLVIAFLLLVSLVLSAALTAASRYLGGQGELWQLVNQAISLAAFTLLFALMYKYIPDAIVRWRDVWIGAAATAVLFTVGKYLIGLYLARPTVSSVYGAVGSLAVLLIWVYYTAQILFLGAEFTQVYARRQGRQIIPDAKAVRITEEERAQQGVPHPARLESAGLAPEVARLEADARASGPRRDQGRRAGAYVILAAGLVTWLVLSRFAPRLAPSRPR